MSKRRLVIARGQVLRSPNTGLTGPRRAVHYPALHSHTEYFFRAGARTEKLGLYPNSFISQRLIMEHVSICSSSQFIHLHGKPHRLFFERELDGLSTRLFFERELDGIAPISVQVIATIGITHGRKPVSPSRNPCDSDPFWSHSQSSTSVAKLFAFMRTTSFCFGPELERNRTWETSLAFLSTTERRLTADRLNLIFLYARSRMRRYLHRRVSAHSSNFGTPSRSSYERACRLEVFASIFSTLFGLAWFVLS